LFEASFFFSFLFFHMGAYAQQHTRPYGVLPAVRQAPRTREGQTSGIPQEMKNQAGKKGKK
jgi:hypothetical protein